MTLGPSRFGEVSVGFAVMAAVLSGCGSCGSVGNTTARKDSGQGGGDSGGLGVDAALPTGREGGVVTYMVGGEIFQIAAARGARPVSLTVKLDSLSSGGGDSFPSVSKNGNYITILTERFDSQCQGWACLALLRGDLGSGEIVMVGGGPLRPEGRTSVSNNGKLLVYPGRDADHQEDILATRSVGGTWSTPVSLTSASPHPYNNDPVLSADGGKVLFDCGPVPYGQEGTGICEVGTDGSGFRQVVNPANSPLGGGTSSNEARHADYSVDGGIVFEADWASEQIWWLAPSSTSAIRILPGQSNDNSPCALPGGYVASLWLERPGSSGGHELKITAPDGSDFAVLTPGVDIADIGMSCHALQGSLSGQSP